LFILLLLLSVVLALLAMYVQRWLAGRIRERLNLGPSPESSPNRQLSGA
jgi:HAMP domain-containing protein